MDNTTQPMAAEIAAVRGIYAALNRNDIEAVVEALDDDIAWIEPAEYGASAYGRAAVAAHLRQARATWAEGSCEPEQVIVSGGRIVAFIYVHVRLKSESDWRVGRHAGVYTFRDGKAIEMRIFDDTSQALAFSLRSDRQ